MKLDGPTTPSTTLTDVGAGENCTCPACGHTDRFDGKVEESVIQCSECKARIGYGALMPRVVVEPHDRWITIRFDDGEAIKLDHDFAAMIGKSLISICKVGT